jgi:putative nucleotidyltransferase with HDIG domain
MNMKALDAIIDQVKTLPPAPRILPQLLALLRRDDSALSEVVRLITFDPALTAQVLRRCNSAHFAFAEPARNLQSAVVRIGTSEIFSIVANLVGESTLGAAQRGYGIGRGELWTHSAVSALAAQSVAHELGGDEWVAFTAALLHDIGKLVLATALEGAYDEVFEKTEHSRLSFLEAEKAILGVEHAEVGGRLLERWNFPDDLIDAVWRHHDPSQAQSARQLAAYVHLGDVLAHMIGHSYGHQANALRCQREVLEILEINSRDLERFLIQTAGRVDKVLALNWIGQSA